ncbi:MAG: hypothetical protein JRF52_01310 [Deltaproteobacteria bacterium]|nr:hypothetical protein [Deltaproteobacteria bacterium]
MKTVFWRLNGDASSVVSGDLEVAPCQVSVSQGNPDTTFNPPNGYVLYNGWNKDSYVGVAIQTDSKIVVSTGILNGTDADVGVLRYNGDGTLDSAFGTDGIVIYDGGKGNDCGRLVAIQTDGKIVLTGYSNNGENYDILTVRYNSDGTLDTSFGTNGIATYNNGNRNDYGRAIAIQSDGEIVVTARSTIVISGVSTSIAMILRYKGDGTLDNTFGTNGVVTYEGGQGNDGFRGVAIQADGKSAVSGYTRTVTEDFDVLTARYNSNGALDNTFGTSGVITYDGGHGNDGARGVAIQSDGKIVVSGGDNNGTDLDVLVLRYNSDGTPDNAFGTNGVVSYDSGKGNDNGRRLAIQGGNKIVVTGNTPNGTDEDVLILRYNVDGSADGAFGSNGVVTLNIVTGKDFGEGVAIQADAKIVIAGGSFNGTDSDVMVLRVIGSGGGSGGGSSGGCFITTAGFGF